MLRLALLVFAVVAMGPRATAQEEYVFTLDGAPLTPEIVTVTGSPGTPAEGDLALVHGILLYLGPPGAYDFRSTPREDGRLLRVSSGGRTEVVGAHTSATVGDQGRIVHDPLAKLDPASLSSLRGVRIGAWTEGTTARLATLDLARCVVQLDYGEGRPRALPVLPLGIRHLKLGADRTPAFEDLSGLDRQTELRVLVVNARPVKLGLLAGATGLVVLDLDRSPIEGLDALARLVALRALALRHCRGVTSAAPLTSCTALRELWLRGTDVSDVGPLRGLSALRFLDVGDTPVADLSPLGGAALDEVVAAGSLVATLPRERLPALTRLALYAAPIADAEVARFAALHPTAKVHHRWKAGLVDAASTATRLRVRTNHEALAQRRLLLDLEGAGHVARFLAMVEIDEAASGGHCLCPGTVSLELVGPADRLLATLDLHHAQALRWSGVWPGDAALAASSGEAICRLLADHGLTAPLDDLLEARRTEARRRLWQRHLAILPSAAARVMARAKVGADVVAALELVADRHERAVLVVRMYGANAAPWNEAGDPIDDALTAELASRPAEELARALDVAVADPDGLAGAARWLYRDDRAWRELPRAALEPLVGRTAAWALGHAQPVNRARTIAVLRRVGGDTARDALRAVLAGQVAVRTPPADLALASGDVAAFTALDYELDPGTSDRARAAWSLAMLGDRPSLEAIRALANAASSGDTKVYADAISVLSRVRD